MNGKRVYLAGKMRGIPLFNFPAFERFAKQWRDAGYDVWSPHENDLEEGFNPATDKPLCLSHYMERDLPQVCKCDIVALIPGWETSEGARLEVTVAVALGKKLCNAQTMNAL